MKKWGFRSYSLNWRNILILGGILGSHFGYCSEAVSKTDPLFYTQVVEAVFSTEDQANSVSAKIAELPDGKKIAFSTRWDDTNIRHVDTVKMLKKHGLKATCYLTGEKLDKIHNVGEKILAEGATIGSHSLSHQRLDTLLPNEIFREIAIERPILESAFNVPVTAFVLPFTKYSCSIDPNVAGYIANSIIRVGYLAQPEPFPNTTSRAYGLPEETIFSSATFSANDRNPDEELFERNLKIAFSKIAENKIPHMTLGIHSWQTDAGLVKLGKMIDGIKSDIYWYCNENEYAAYRKQFLSSKIEKMSVDGKKAFFKLIRPRVRELGNEIPISMEFSSAPVAVLGVKAEISDNVCKVYHDDSERNPARIDYVKILKGNKAHSKKFSEIEVEMKLNLEENPKISLAINSSKNIHKGTVQFILPLCYDTPEIFAFDGERKVSFDANLATENKGAIPDLFREGNMIFFARCDFIMDDKPCRIWVSKEIKQPITESDCTRDLSISTNYFSVKDANFSSVKKMSIPGARLKKVAGKEWKHSLKGKKYREFLAYYNGYGALKETLDKKESEDSRAGLACADFEAPKDGIYDLFVGRCTRSIFVNGESVDVSKDPIKVQFKRGTNRVILEFRMRGGPQIFAVKDENGKFLNCVKIK